MTAHSATVRPGIRRWLGGRSWRIHCRKCGTVGYTNVSHAEADRLAREHNLTARKDPS